MRTIIFRPIVPSVHAVIIPRFARTILLIPQVTRYVRLLRRHHRLFRNASSSAPSPFAFSALSIRSSARELLPSPRSLPPSRDPDGSIFGCISRRRCRSFARTSVISRSSTRASRLRILRRAAAQKSTSPYAPLSPAAPPPSTRLEISLSISSNCAVLLSLSMSSTSGCTDE